MKLPLPFFWDRRRRAGHGRKRREGSTAAPAARTGSWLSLCLAVAVIWVSALVAVFLPTSYHPKYQYVVGQLADRFIYSEQGFDYEDPADTQRRRREAAAATAPVFRINNALLEDTLRRFADVCDIVRAGSGGDKAPEPPPAALVPGSGGGQAATPPPVALLVAGLTASQRDACEYLVTAPAKLKLLERLLTDVFRQGIANDLSLRSHYDGLAVHDTLMLVDSYERKTVVSLAELATPELAARQIAASFTKAYPERVTVTEDLLNGLLPKLLAPNLVYDVLATEKARERAADAVPAVRRSVAPSTALLRRAEPITADDLTRLENYEKHLANGGGVVHDWQSRAVVAPLLLAIILCAVYCLHAIHPEVVNSKSLLWLTVTILVLQMALNRAAGDLYYLYSSAGPFYLGVFLPLSFGAMLLAPLIGLRVAVWGGLVSALVAAWHHEQSLHLFVLGSMSAFAAAGLMRGARKRYHAFRTGVGVGVVVGLICGAHMVEARLPLGFYYWLFPLGLATGVLTAIAAAAVTPLFEYLFGVASDLTLLELSDLNHPLLKRLQLEAPGTYHHSLIVATISEAAAAAIGANPLLTRVCAYFHDIGKLENPDYFTENSMGGQDLHEELQPRMSTLVIMNHVKAGLDLAAEYKLKRPLREAIAQHHGTNLVYYFYRRAVARQQSEDPERTVGEHEYRYQGPLPARKEIVIISLADSCEAGVRSLEKQTPQKIEALVEEILLKRLRDGQFDAADLTLEELAVVKSTIIKSLATLHHGRVRYPREGDNNDEGDLFKSVNLRDTQRTGTTVSPA